MHELGGRGYYLFYKVKPLIERCVYVVTQRSLVV
jgi:hypothetical protein